MRLVEVWVLTKFDSVFLQACFKVLRTLDGIVALCCLTSLLRRAWQHQFRSPQLRSLAWALNNQPFATALAMNCSLLVLSFVLALPSIKGVSFDSGAGVAVHAFGVGVSSGLAATCADPLCFGPKSALSRFLTVSKETGR